MALCVFINLKTINRRFHFPWKVWIRWFNKMNHRQLPGSVKGQDGIKMVQEELAGKMFDLDEDGFIQDATDWDEAVAAALAPREGVDDLTEEHWTVINYIRDYYKEFGVAPMIRKLCKETKCDMKKIYALFPSGPAKGACKLAGLPKPTGCV